jgi:hypothetical protein
MLDKYKTKKDAIARAKELGCLGAHQMKDEQYMPCKTHDRYKEVTKKSKPQGEIDELVDADGTMLSSKIPILDPHLHPRKTMDQTVAMSRNVYDIFRMGYRRYFYEEDMSKAFGYDDTKFMNAKETIKFLEKELGLEPDDAEDRAMEFGKKPKLDKSKDEDADQKLYLFEKGDDVVEDAIVKRSKDSGDISIKNKSISKILKKNVQFLKKMAEKEGYSINELIKMLKSE